ncbi:MAG: NAD(P)-binding protein [Deltaproteobacteria bacterium]|nr:NAD(P)-binding protein [Deltaproteobacteria bacterium]
MNPSRGIHSIRDQYDVVVVGGGPGGLATAALLCQGGMRPLVVEQKPTLGGRYRAIEFAGCRVDIAEHLLTGMVNDIDDAYAKQVFDKLGLALAQKEIKWVMGLVGRSGGPAIDFFSMDRTKGVENFFDFFSFAAGMPLGELEKAEMSRIFHLMADMSPEACRKQVHMSFAEWLDRHVQNPVVHMVLAGVTGPLQGSTADKVNIGQMANIFGSFPRIGAVPFWYPANGILADTIIAPLATYIRAHGGDVVCGVKARRVLFDGHKVSGVWMRDEDEMLREVQTPRVVVAYPIQFAVGFRRLIPDEMLTPEGRASIAQLRELSHEDLTVFYLLRERVIPEDYYGWIHLFDAAEGQPNYVGDWILGDMINAKVPTGKQLVGNYITANFEGTQFGLDASPAMVRKAINKWEAAVEKVFPDFTRQVEARVYNLQLNWGRYSYSVMPRELSVRALGVEGLYFAGDSILSVSSLASDKVYDVALQCAEAVLNH